MNYILDSALSSSDGEFPITMPTCRLTPEALLHVRQLLKPEDKLLCLLSWGERDSLRHWAQDPNVFPRLERMFDFEVDAEAPRHDLINGEWSKRVPGTPEYEYALTEDVVLMDRAQAGGAVIRCRRTAYHYLPSVSPL